MASADNINKTIDLKKIGNWEDLFISLIFLSLFIPTNRAGIKIRKAIGKSMDPIGNKKIINPSKANSPPPPDKIATTVTKMTKATKEKAMSFENLTITPELYPFC